MQIAMLIEAKMKPIPADLKLVQSFDENLSVIGTNKHVAAHGEHAIVEGTEDAIKAWLKPFDGVWVGEGAPMMQQFSIMHVR